MELLGVFVIPAGVSKLLIIPVQSPLFGMACLKKLVFFANFFLL